MAYGLEIKHRNVPPKPYKWEIYEDGKPLWVDQSGEAFSSREKAIEAGTAAVERLENRKSLNRGK
jgi:hypothetical protein